MRTRKQVIGVPATGLVNVVRTHTCFEMRKLKEEGNDEEGNKVKSIKERREMV